MLYIGIDDTDSVNGMCTTYLAALVADEISKFSKANLKLVRLNPNIEWKTRGNAGLCLEIETKEVEKVKKIALDAVQKYSVFEDENTNPGVVFFEGTIPKDFTDFYYKALHEIVSLERAEGIARQHGAEVYKFKNGRGIIGALAAIGADLKDCTYEIIAYKAKENLDKKRQIDEKSVYEMDARTFPLTFNNIDYSCGRILIMPRSKCPVLLGIRGENPEILKQAYKMLKINEKVERIAIFKTNQGTDAHLQEVSKISEVKPYSSVILKGTVLKKPKTIEGGHVIFPISDGKTVIDCAAYEPTKNFRNIVKELEVGDEVRVYGGVRNNPYLTINLEKLEILRLAEQYEERNPVCDICNKRMESAGKNQGFRCKKCKIYKNEKIKIKVDRALKEELYSVPPCAMRHLSKPLSRIVSTSSAGATR